MTIFILSAVEAWALCGVLAYGATLAHFQRRFPLQANANYVYDHHFAMFIALLGPIGITALLVTSWIICGAPFYHGLQFGREDRR